MPERSEPYDPHKEPERIEARRRQTAKNLGRAAADTTVITVPLEHLPYHEKLQEALNTEGRVEKAVFREGSHEGYIKNAEGEIEYTRPLHAERMIFSVNFDTEPKWIPVNRVESVRLPRREKKESDALRKGRRAVILPDMQFPHHDPDALDTALQIVRDAKPDKVIILGDLLDLAAFSKYEQRPEFAAHTQTAIVEAHKLLATLRKLAPTAEISVHEGNHDARMTKSILRNAMQAFGLKRADQPEGWPVLSVPFLTAMDTLDIDYISGYPANRQWINQNLQVRHGHLVRSRGSTAKAVNDDERTSTIFGHVHRLETQYKTHHTFEGGKTNAAFSIGCLCRIDGTVPSVHSGIDLMGRPVQNYENWQQAICVVDYEEGDGPFNVQPIYINTLNAYEAYYNGKRYAARGNGS